MIDQLISFETAKLAKEKGFDIIPRFGHEASLYDKKSNHVYYSNYGFMYSGLNEGYISAPTQSLLQKWLREIYGIHIQIVKHGNMWDYIIEEDKTPINHNDYMSISYEKALELSLQEALKLIKI